VKKGESHKMLKMAIYAKHENAQNVKTSKCQNDENEKVTFPIKT